MYVLIFWVIVGQYHAGSASVSLQKADFESKIACEQAGKAFQTYAGNNSSVGHFICVSKTGDTSPR